MEPLSNIQGRWAELFRAVEKAGDPVSAIELTEVELLHRTCARQLPLLGLDGRNEAAPAIGNTGLAAYLGSLCRTSLRRPYLSVADASAPILDSICNPNLGMDCSRAKAVNIACGGGS